MLSLVGASERTHLAGVGYVCHFSWQLFISALAGIVLGLRYKVAILVPAVGFVMMFVMVVAIARGDPFWSIILAIAIPGTVVQLGYLAGISVRGAVG
jgi:hypothetical protein